MQSTLMNSTKPLARPFFSNALPLTPVLTPRRGEGGPAGAGSGEGCIGTVRRAYRLTRPLMLFTVMTCALSLNTLARPNDDARARKFIARHEAKIRPLE